MVAYELNSSLSQKIEYLRDKVKTLKKDNDKHFQHIKQNNHVIHCIENNLNGLDKANQIDNGSICDVVA